MVIRTCFRLLISFVPEHLQKRVRLHKNVAALRTHIGPTRLPLEYGGSAASWTVMANRWIEQLRNNRAFLVSLNEMGLDEKRITSMGA